MVASFSAISFWSHTVINIKNTSLILCKKNLGFSKVVLSYTESTEDLCSFYVPDFSWTGAYN